ncbi:hypothetical protein KZ368_11215, partial [Glaesserella parasuis]|nr:hypothetical protein [Glaesserella parasuis]
YWWVKTHPTIFNPSNIWFVKELTSPACGGSARAKARAMGAFVHPENVNKGLRCFIRKNSREAYYE